MVQVTQGWSGHWIAPDAPDQSLNPFSGLRGQAPALFSRSLYRRAFELSGRPDHAPARLTADSRYVLWVNGAEVGRGPARSQPARQRYDTYDLAPYLVNGTNVIAVLVTYYGQATSFWMPAPAGGALGRDAVLVFEAQLGGKLLVSDGEWRAQRSSAWTLAPELGPLGGLPVEILDARELPAGWQEAGFDDSAWNHAGVLRAAHPGALGRSTPPTYPYGRLLPRGISDLGGPRVDPAGLFDCSTRRAPAWEDDHPVLRVRQVLAEPAEPPTTPAEPTEPPTAPVEPATQPTEPPILPAEPATTPAEAAEPPTTAAIPATALPVSFDVGPERVQHLGFDFGRIVAGFVELDLDAPAGTVVELHYRERAYQPGSNAMFEPTTGARYIAPGGATTFAANEINGLRYVHLAVHADEAATVTISRLQVREFLYPRTGDSYFTSDDAALDALYRAGVRTVELNSFDSYTDCPTREQRAWVGDGVVHQLVDLVTNDDWGLARNYIEVGDSPRPDGILPMSVVGDIEAGGGLTIPDWSLSWIHGLRTLYQYQGDLETVRRHLPTAERVLRWYAAYLDERGTICDVPEWSLVDWAALFLDGRSSILTGLWARGLVEFAELSDAVDRSDAADWARGLYAKAAEGFEDFWDAERGLYADHILDGTRQAPTSQMANAAAIVSGLAPRDRWRDIVQRMTDPARLVVRSWVGNADGTYDAQRMADQMRGIRHPDWDIESEIVIAQPFASYVVHDAAAAAGCAEQLVDLVRRWEQFLTDGYDTFGECWGWGTPVHGWSCTPSRDLVAYVLGITPSRPGYAQARVAPRPGPLNRLSGSVPTPHGPIEVRVDGTDAEINSPVPVLVVPENGPEVELPAGTHHVTVRG